MRTVPIKVASAWPRIYHEIDSQLIFLNLNQELSVSVLPGIFLTFICLVDTRGTQDFSTIQKQY